jgi:hypothetical protein
MSISSGMEKGLGFLEDDEGNTNELDKGRLNLYDSPEVGGGRKVPKRFSVDDLKNQSSYNNFNNLTCTSSYFERLMKQQQLNNFIGDISEINTNSDHYSHRSNVSSNFSASPNKKLLNNFSQISQPCVTNVNLLYGNHSRDISRRSSNDFNPSLLHAMRDMALQGNSSKSARHSVDFSNMVFNINTNCFNYQFNNNNNNNVNNMFDDKHILDNVLLLLKDQNGCRLIQKKLEEKSPEYAINIFEKIQNNLFEIIIDQFGNYVVQKIIDFIYNDKYLVTRFFELIRPNIYIVSVNQYGTRVFQRLLDYFCVNYNKIENQVINEIFKELVLNHTSQLIADTDGNHVFQKVLMLYPKHENNFIYEELVKICFEISKSKKGGCIFQRAFELANYEQKVRAFITF